MKCCSTDGVASPFTLHLLPGSFNPLHDGHRGMLNYAVKHCVPEQDRCHPVHVIGFYELSCRNADKGSLQLDELLERLAQFSVVSSSKQKSETEDSYLYPVLITRAPLLVDKVRLLKCPATLLIGVDTYMRLMEPKYYQPPSAVYLSTVLMEFFFKGIRFLVFGRATESVPKSLISSLESAQRVTAPQGKLPSFLALSLCQSLLPSISESSLAPADSSILQGIIQQLFHPAVDFRVDLSSTFLRAQHQQGAKQ